MFRGAGQPVPPYDGRPNFKFDAIDKDETVVIANTAAVANNFPDPDLSFSKAQKRSEQEMKEIQLKILQHLEA